MSPDREQEAIACEQLGEKRQEIRSLSMWDLLHIHFFQRKFPGPTWVLLAVFSIIIYDNYAGVLTDWSAVWWSLQKSGVIVGIYVAFIFGQLISALLFQAVRKWLPSLFDDSLR